MNYPFLTLPVVGLRKIVFDPLFVKSAGIGLALPMECERGPGPKRNTFQLPPSITLSINQSEKTITIFEFSYFPNFLIFKITKILISENS